MKLIFENITLTIKCSKCKTKETFSNLNTLPEVISHINNYGWLVDVNGHLCPRCATKRSFDPEDYKEDLLQAIDVWESRSKGDIPNNNSACPICSVFQNKNIEICIIDKYLINKGYIAKEIIQNDKGCTSCKYTPYEITKHTSSYEYRIASIGEACFLKEVYNYFFLED